MTLVVTVNDYKLKSGDVYTTIQFNKVTFTARFNVENVNYSWFKEGKLVATTSSYCPTTIIGNNNKRIKYTVTATNGHVTAAFEIYFRVHCQTEIRGSINVISNGSVINKPNYHAVNVDSTEVIILQLVPVNTNIINTNYQWYMNYLSNPIEGATCLSYTVPRVTKTTTYIIEASDPFIGYFAITLKPFTIRPIHDVIVKLYVNDALVSDCETVELVQKSIKINGTVHSDNECIKCSLSINNIKICSCDIILENAIGVIPTIKQELTGPETIIRVSLLVHGIVSKTLCVHVRTSSTNELIAFLPRHFLLLL